MRFARIFLSGLIIFGVLILSNVVLAAEFSADMISNQFGQQTKGKVYFKGHKVRFEGMSPEGEVSVAIMDLQSGRVITLIPQEKMYIEMSGAAAQSQMDQFDVDEGIAKVADKKDLGTEKVNGYVCDKYELIYHDPSMGKMTQWFSKRLGYPIKVIYNHPSGKMITEYKNIREGAVSDSLFQIPPGYQKMSMPTMSPGMVQGMKGMGEDVDVSDLLGW